MENICHRRNGEENMSIPWLGRWLWVRGPVELCLSFNLRLCLHLFALWNELRPCSAEANRWPSYETQTQTVPFSSFIRCSQTLIVSLTNLDCIYAVCFTMVDCINYTVCLCCRPNVQIFWIILIKPSLVSFPSLLFVKVWLKGPHPPLLNTLNRISSEGFVKHSLVGGLRSWLTE